jgi:hypothetical protein
VLCVVGPRSLYLFPSERIPLDCIAELEIASSSILVTSHAEDAALRERCVAMKVVLLPKSAASFVKIRVGATRGLDFI